MWIATQWAQVIAGAGFACLGEPGRFLLHAVDKWFSSHHDCLADYECTPAIVNTYIVYLRRVYDRILMDEVLAGWYTNSDIQAISRCRLYRQVECLSDIYTADGLSGDRTPGKTSYCHFREYDHVAVSRASQPTLVGSMAPLPHPVYMCFIDQPTTPRSRPMDVRPDLRTWPGRARSLFYLCHVVQSKDAATSRFGSSYSLGGIGLRHLYGEEGLLKISALLEHIREHDRLGQRMWIEVQWAQVTAGAGFA
jgi:hypothetical protein